MRARLQSLIAGPQGVFQPGDVVTDAQLPGLDALVAAGHAVPVGEREVERAVVGTPETADIKHVGAGWYVLPDGRRIRGKAAALAALEE